MVTTASHEKRLADKEFQAEKLTPEFAALRGAHLEKLGPLEELIRELSPLPMSYDVSRLQPPFHYEFAYTEMLGCIWVSPQSSELAARVVQSALKDKQPVTFDAVANLAMRDKYDLEEPLPKKRPKHVAFVPADNAFDDSISPDLLLRLMHENKAMAIKVHPLASEGLIRKLGMAFNYPRVIGPLVSGYALLPGLERAYVSGSTEMGFYAVLAGIPIENIGRFPSEARGVYSPFYRLLWGKPVEEAKATLVKLLNSPLSGFFHPDDPDLKAKLRRYFRNAMRLRAPFEPLVYEFGPERWPELLVSRARAPQAQPQAAIPPAKPKKDPADAVG